MSLHFNLYWSSTHLYCFSVKNKELWPKFFFLFIEVTSRSCHWYLGTNLGMHHLKTHLIIITSLQIETLEWAYSNFIDISTRIEIIWKQHLFELLVSLLSHLQHIRSSKAWNTPWFLLPHVFTLLFQNFHNLFIKENTIMHLVKKWNYVAALPLSSSYYFFPIIQNSLPLKWHVVESNIISF